MSAPVIVLAPDSFKGSLDAPAVCAALEAGLRRVWPDAHLRALPDGRWRRGDARRRPRRVGQRRHARCADGARRRWRPGGGRLRRPRRTTRLAVLEVAQVVGDHRSRGDARGRRRARHARRRRAHPRAASTGGVRRFMIGLGGSSTNDGGAGMLAALGMRLLDAAGQPVRADTRGPRAHSPPSTPAASTRGLPRARSRSCPTSTTRSAASAARRRSSARRRASPRTTSPRFDARNRELRRAGGSGHRRPRGVAAGRGCRRRPGLRAAARRRRVPLRRRRGRGSHRPRRARSPAPTGRSPAKGAATRRRCWPRRRSSSRSAPARRACRRRWSPAPSTRRRSPRWAITSPARSASPRGR